MDEGALGNDIKTQQSEKGQLPKNEGMVEELEQMREKLHDSFNTLFRATMGGTYARNSEEGFSGDAASIYVLVVFKNKSGEATPELVKVGWGEFSKQTFEGDKYPAFRNFPFDIFCVSQRDSYFANESLRQEMIENPQKYLSERSLFVANNGQVQTSELTDDYRHNLKREIEAVPYNEMLRTVRNQIIARYSSPEEFANFLRELPDDLEELSRYITRLHMKETDWLITEEDESWENAQKRDADFRKISLLGRLVGMGIYRIGVAVGDRKAMESISALKREFNFTAGSF